MADLIGQDGQTHAEIRPILCLVRVTQNPRVTPHQRPPRLPTPSITQQRAVRPATVKGHMESRSRGTRTCPSAVVGTMTRHRASRNPTPDEVDSKLCTNYTGIARLLRLIHPWSSRETVLADGRAENHGALGRGLTAEIGHVPAASTREMRAEKEDRLPWTALSSGNGPR